MAKRKALELTEEGRAEFEGGLRRLMARWRKNNLAKAGLDERDKDLRSQIRVQLEVLGADLREVMPRDAETPGVRAQLVVKKSVKTSDEKNLALCLARVARPDRERCCPRRIDVKEMERSYPELLGELKTKRTTTLRLDLVQAEAARRSA